MLPRRLLRSLLPLLVLLSLLPASPARAARVDPNTADATALEELPGVGPATAARIVEARRQGGPFRDAADLQSRVKGIGPVKIRKMLDGGLALPAGAPGTAARKGAAPVAAAPAPVPTETVRRLGGGEIRERSAPAVPARPAAASPVAPSPSTATPAVARPAAPAPAARPVAKAPPAPVGPGAARPPSPAAPVPSASSTSTAPVSTASVPGVPTAGRPPVPRGDAPRGRPAAEGA